MIKVGSTELGEIFVDLEVVETIAGMAAIDCYGLVGMVAKNFQAGIVSILGIESLRKGVKVENTENGLIIDVFVIMAYGTKIREIANSVMHKVAYILDEKAGLPVEAVNVNVMGIKYVP